MNTRELVAWALVALLSALAYFFRPRGASKPPNSPVEARRHATPAQPLPEPDERLQAPPTQPAEPVPGSRVDGGLGRDHAEEFVRSVL